MELLLTFPNFEYKYFVRYVANNCDSEQMVKNSSEIDEAFIVGNMLEYLNEFWAKRWGEVKKNYTIPELNFDKSPGHPKQMDCVCFTKEGKYKLCIEVKFVRGDISRFPNEIMTDIFRLKQLKGDNTIGGTRRCILIAGQRRAMDELFEKKEMGKILRFPTIKTINSSEDMQQINSEIIIKEKKYNYSVKEEYLKKYKNLDYYTKDVQVQILGVYRPNISGFLWKKHEDDPNFIDVGLWEIRP